MRIKVELLKSQWGYYLISINDRLLTHESCHGTCTIIQSFIVKLDEEGNVVKLKRKGE